MLGLARLATTNVTDWKLEQREDPVLYQVVKHRKASRETFKEALLKVTDQKATMAYVKSKEHLIMKNGLLYRQSKQGPIEETVFQFVVPQIHRSAALDGCSAPGSTSLFLSHARVILVARYGP